MINGYHNLVRSEIYDLVPKTALNILDIGCGAGFLGKAIKDRQSCKYTGVEFDSESADLAKFNIDEVYTHDLDIQPLPLIEKYDCIILADVLEHLKKPENLLKILKEKHASNDCKYIVSLPNIRHFTVIMPLLIFGKWQYEDKGIMDRTHLRFFTKSTCINLFTSSNLRVEVITPNLRYKKRIYKYFNRLMLNVFTDFFAQQWLFVLRNND